MTQILQRLENGEGRTGDIELLESLCSGIFGRCFCALGDAAVMALRGALKNFREEFEYHITHKRCMVSD
jgi:NADH-quinone oxidoreductase subunit F